LRRRVSAVQRPVTMTVMNSGMLSSTSASNHGAWWRRNVLE
jgi:hypothetical protein